MKKLIFILVAVIPFVLFSQTFPGQQNFQWPDNNFNHNIVPDSLKNEDAVILSEQLTITDNIIRRRVVVKIQTPEGLKDFKNIQLPENFDLTNPTNLNVQGRFKDRKDPFIYAFRINYFASRVIKKDKKYNDQNLKFKSEKVYWIKRDGTRVYDYVYNFDMEDVEVGDILDYTYEAEVDWNFNQNSIYPNSKYPKLNCDMEVKAGIRADVKNVELIYNYKINPSAYKKTIQNKNGDQIHCFSYHFDYLKGYNAINYLRPGFTLPSISVNHGAYAAASSGGATKIFHAIDRYKWALLVDTTNTNLFDKYHSNIRKFLSGISSDPTDTSGNAFVAQLVDTLNKLKFISTESMKYGDIPQYALPSSEQLVKGRMTEEFVLKNYSDFLSEKKIYYYGGIIIDKRKSVINPDYRNQTVLERGLIVIPEKRSFKYYVPRHRGVLYLPDELPFYFENTSCALMPCSHCSRKSEKLQLSFIVIPKSTFNENTRSESSSIRVSTDSLKMSLLIKENLSGQFSTLLRHYYNNDFIDSTISESYYKKCTDKPGVVIPKIKKGSLSKKFPFRQTYTCNADIKLNDKKEINLANWFSFTWSKEQFARTPNHEIYPDFQLSDYYNYLFEFDKTVEILNADDFTKKMSNEYFEVTSNLVKQDANKYLLSVIVKVKQDIIPQKDAIKITDFVSMLDYINHLKINYKIL